MTEKQYRLNKWGTRLLKNNRPLFDWTNESDEIVDLLNQLNDKNEQLKSENKRLTDKLNKTALELVDGCISQGKATEISEMSYREFLDYRAKNGKPMELQK